MDPTNAPARKSTPDDRSTDSVVPVEAPRPGAEEVDMIGDFA